MDDRIDLDAAAQQIEARRDVWRDAGMTVGETTWRDEADGWPWELKTSRSNVRKPDSVGVALSKGKQEGSVVLFRRGWADLLYWNGESDEVVDETPRAASVACVPRSAIAGAPCAAMPCAGTRAPFGRSMGQFARNDAGRCVPTGLMTDAVDQVGMGAVSGSSGSRSARTA